MVNESLDRKLLAAIVFFGFVAFATGSKVLQGRGAARRPVRRAPVRRAPVRPGARINPNAVRPPHKHPKHDPSADPYRGSSADTDPEVPEPNPEAPEDEGYVEGDDE